MDLKFSGQELITASKDRVWAFINDPQQIGACLPDVLELHVNDAHSLDVTVKVSVGPVSGKFKFKILLEPATSADHMGLQISGGGFGSVVDLDAAADLKDNGDQTTTLDWRGQASMRGPVATVGGRVLDAQAKRVISTTFANVKARVSAAAV
jgi:carbon monoxide dehydrogenase subunit G